MPSLSYQEKSLYGTLAAELAVYVPYFFFMPHRTLSELVGMMVIVIVVQIVLQSIIAAVTRNRLTDERDRLIALRGYRAGYLTLVSCIIFGLAMIWVHGALGLVNPEKLAVHFLNAFFFMLMLAEIVKTLTQLAAYRRAS